MFLLEFLLSIKDYAELDKEVGHNYSLTETCFSSDLSPKQSSDDLRLGF